VKAAASLLPFVVAAAVAVVVLLIGCEGMPLKYEPAHVEIIGE